MKSTCAPALLLLLVGVARGQDAAELVPPPIPVPEPLIGEGESGIGGPVPEAAQHSSDGKVLAYEFGVSLVQAGGGIRVQGVVVGSRAEAAGVKPNDVIVGVNGAEPSIDTLKDGQVQSLRVLRDGQTRELTVSTPRPVRRSASYAAPQTGEPTYSVPRRTVSAPPSYYYRPGYRAESRYSYPARLPDYGYSRRSFYSQPSVRIGIGTGPGYSRGYRGFGYPGYGFGPRYGSGIGIGYGPAFGRGGYYGRGSGIGFSIRF